MEKREIIYKKTKDLIPYARNSRTHSDEQVAQISASIKEFGFTNPILIDEDGLIIAGHGRVQAAQRLKLDEVPAIVLEYLTEAQKKAYVIADNKLAINAGWDFDMLKVEFNDLIDMDFDLSLIGFDGKELNQILADPTEGLVDADTIPETPVEPISKVGDMWLLGNHRLLCGDSTLVDNIDRLMMDKQSDLIVTDPPYNVDYEGKTKNALKISNDSMDDQQFRQFLVDAFTNMNIALKPGGGFYIWHADSEGYNFRGACHDVGWKVRQCLIWNKNSMVLGRQDYHWKHEPCLYGWKDGASHKWNTDRKQTTVLEFSRPSKNIEHPTMKPIDLIAYQIENSSYPNDLVLDLFLGSGSTLIASEKTGRVCYGMELDPKYADVIIKRWQDFTGKDAIHEELGKTYNELSND